jgi:Tol biopolymer transport system component
LYKITLNMRILTALLLICVFASCKNDVKKPSSEILNTETTAINEREALIDTETKDTLIYPEETYFKNIRQVTFGGDNAEAYWSFDDKQLVFQSNYKEWGVECDQMFLMNADEKFKGTQPPIISTGKGRTTCAYFLPDNKHYVYGSTHLVDENCPEVPLRTNIGYDAEATVSPKGDKIVFTSTRSGDLELWTMNLDGSDKKQITDELGYDGGAFFSPDGTKLIFRSSRPKTDEEVKKYKDLLANGLVEPTDMELYICDADGSNLKQLTNLGNANWSPFFHPSGNKILFSSNHEAVRGFPFNLYLIDLDGKNLERVTHGETFDAFPVFSNDGKYLAFSSNRNNGGGRDTNLFIAEWKD